MQLNSIKPPKGANRSRRRVGRGIGCGLGKTAGRGHKGQKSRSGGFHKVGFEGGQMPLYRRLPKRGFHSMTKASNAEIRLSDLERLDIEQVDLLALRQAGLIGEQIKTVKLINTGSITRKMVLQGIRATASAKKAVEMLGGSVN